MKDVVLIVIAIFCVFLTSLNAIFHNPGMGESADVLLSGYTPIFYCLTHIGVAYFFARYSQRSRDLRALLLISVILITINAIFFAASFVEPNADLIKKMVLLCTFHRAFQPTVLILSWIYLFRVNPESSHLKISAALIAATFMATYCCSCLECISDLTFSASFPLFSCTVGLGVYRYLGKNLSLQKIKTSRNAVLPTNSKILVALIAAASASGIFFNHKFLSCHLVDVAIVDPQMIYSKLKHYGLFVLFLYPAALLAEKIGKYRCMMISLMVLFVLTSQALARIVQAPGFYMLHQILFSLSLATFAVPSLPISYKLLSNHAEPYREGAYQFFWYVAGFSIVLLVSAYQKPIVKISGIHDFGWLFFNLTIGLCILASWKYRDLFSFSQAKLQKLQ